MEEKSHAGGVVGSARAGSRLARIAAKQHGVIGRRQLLGVGLTDREIAGRVDRGQLHRVYTGVYAVGHPRLTREGRWMAAVVACGQGAVLSHLDAAVLWGFWNRLGARIHVTVKWQRRVNALILHRTRRLDTDEVTTKNGIPVTTVERTFVDLTDELNDDRLLRAMREAEYHHLLDLDALSAAVERAHGRRKFKGLKQAIAQHRPGQIIRGELEHRFAQLSQEAGLEQPDTNVPSW